ncbi:MAG: hypothetical protein U1F43_36490 [Myxococcota bacterium]
MKRLALGLVPLSFACSQPERRADVTSDTQVVTVPAPDTAATPVPDTMAPVGKPDASTATASGPTPTTAPPGDDEAKKRLIEEYKSLALKNDCSKGYKDLPGTWKFVGQSKTPNYADTLTIDGTRFKEVISGNPDGKYLSAELGGEMRCVFKNRMLVQIDKVEPDGAYGNHVGDLYPCDLLHDMDDKVDRMLMICYFDWDLRTAAGLEFEWERQGPGSHP